jgi:hypothetical protein
MATHSMSPGAPGTDDRDTRPELEPEVALAGWDPYIVSITSAEAAGPDAAPRRRATDTPVTRETRILDWLRNNGA